MYVRAESDDAWWENEICWLRYGFCDLTAILAVRDWPEPIRYGDYTVEVYVA